CSLSRTPLARDCLHLPSPSSVSAFGRSTFSHEGRREVTAGSRLRPLLPLWEKVPEGRMRGTLAKKAKTPGCRVPSSSLHRPGHGALGEEFEDQRVDRQDRHDGDEDHAGLEGADIDL